MSMPKPILLVSLISCMAAYLLAQDATLEGKVLNSLTGAPVAGARLLLANRDKGLQYHASTDSQGRFVFSAVAAAEYELIATRNGYVDTAGALRRSDETEPLSLRAGEARAGMELRMSPAAVISGRVLDNQGEPMAGLAVAPGRIRYTGRGREMTGMGKYSVATSIVFTNDRGEYRIYGLPPGRYYVMAMGLEDLVADFAGLGDPSRVNSAKMTDASPNEVLGTQYYPGTPDPAQAVALEVRAGDEKVAVDIRYDSTPLVRVRGRLAVPASCTGEIHFSATREIDTRQEYPIQVVYSDDGTFELRGFSPGTWRIAAEEWKKMAQKPGCSTTQAVVQVGPAGADGVFLAMQPRVDLAGVAHVDHAPGFPLEGVRLWAESMEGGDDGGAEVKTGGSFTMALGPSHWSFGAEGLPANAFLKSARMGHQDVLDAGLDLSSGPPSGLLEIVFSTAGAQVDGLVVDASDRPAAGAMVALVPEPRRRAHGRLFRKAVTDRDGRFTLRGIAPGEYKLFAWDDLDGEAYRDRNFLSAYEELGQRLDAQENEAKQTRLRLIVR